MTLGVSNFYFTVLVFEMRNSHNLIKAHQISSCFCPFWEQILVVMPRCSVSSMRVRWRLWALLSTIWGQSLTHLPRPRCPPTKDSSIDTDLWQTRALEVIRGYYISDAPQGMLRRPWRRRFSNRWQWAMPPISCPNASVSARSSNYCWGVFGLVFVVVSRVSSFKISTKKPKFERFKSQVQ